MGNPYQVLGTCIVVPSGTTLAWSGTVQDVSTLATQAISGSASLTAGTYSPLDLMIHCAKQLRISIYNAMAALPAWFTTLPATNVTIPVKVGLQASGPTADSIGATLLRIECATTGGALHTGNATRWSVFTLNNSSNNNWALLGLARIAESRSLTIAAGGFSEDGRFQPRWLFCFRASFQDSGDLRQWGGHFADVLANGTVSQYDFGANNVAERDLVLVDQPQHIVGVPWVIGAFGSFGATRNLLGLLTRDETYLVNLSSTYKCTTNLSSPAYLRCNNWWARYYQESPTDTLACFDVWPTSIEPDAGEPIQAYPESEALVEEIRRVGLVFRFATKDVDGTTYWVGNAYALRTGANPRPVRRNNGNLYYSVSIPLVLVPNPQLATP